MESGREKMRMQTFEFARCMEEATRRGYRMFIREEMRNMTHYGVLSGGISEWFPFSCYGRTLKWEAIHFTRTLELDRTLRIDFDPMTGRGTIADTNKKVNAEVRLEIPDTM